jgi:riboflavin synthase
MFTGLIDDVGVVERVERTDAGRELRILSRYTGLTPGESIAVNGACLTVREQGEGWFSVAAIVTTLERTTIGEWVPGRRVNLERAMRLGDRLGGHMVQGHVDAVALVESVRRHEDALLIDVRLPDELEPLMVPHGSVAVDGVSLTVTRVDDRAFEVSLIPETLERTNLTDASAGRRVNLEVDVIAKYVEKLVVRP